MADAAPKKITDNPPKPSQPASQNYVVRLFAKLDQILPRLTIIVATPAGTDSLLRTVTYTLQFIVCGLNSIVTNHMDKVMSMVVKLNRLSQSIMPRQPSSGSGEKSNSTSVLARLPSPPALVPTLMTSIPRARAFSSLISDFRSFTR